MVDKVRNADNRFCMDDRNDNMNHVESLAARYFDKIRKKKLWYHCCKVGHNAFDFDCVYSHFTPIREVCHASGFSLVGGSDRWPGTVKYQCILQNW